MAQINYDSSSVVLGDELFLYLDGKPVAYTTSCSLSINGDTIDTSNKMDGVWASAKSGKLSWTISSENLMADTNGTSFEDFYDKMIARTPFEVKFGRATTVTGATPNFDLNTAKPYYVGTAYLTSCELNADNGSAVSMSVELQGNGKLEKKTAA